MGNDILDFGALVMVAIAVMATYDRYRFKKAIEVIVTGDKPNSEKAEEIIAFTGSKGFLVHHQGENQVQMLKKKQFSLLLAIVLLLLGCLAFAPSLIFLAIYVLYFMAKKDEIETFNLNGGV